MTGGTPTNSNETSLPVQPVLGNLTNRSLHLLVPPNGRDVACSSVIRELGMVCCKAHDTPAKASYDEGWGVHS